MKQSTSNEDDTSLDYQTSHYRIKGLKQYQKNLKFLEMKLDKLHPAQGGNIFLMLQEPFYKLNTEIEKTIKKIEFIEEIEKSGSESSPSKNQVLPTLTQLTTSIKAFLKWTEKFRLNMEDPTPLPHIIENYRNIISNYQALYEEMPFFLPKQTGKKNAMDSGANQPFENERSIF